VASKRFSGLPERHFRVLTSIGMIESTVGILKPAVIWLNTKPTAIALRQSEPLHRIRPLFS
jgi:hypothetical protein